MSAKIKKSKPLRRRKFLVGFSITLLFLLSLTALVFAYENWSGAREWERVRDKLVGAGVELDPQALLTELPPAQNNFGGHSLIASLTRFASDESGEIHYDKPEAVERFRRMTLPDVEIREPVFANWRNQEAANLKAVSEALGKDGPPAQAIQSWMQEMGPDLSEIDRAAERPHAVMPFDMADDFLSQISTALPYMSDLMSFQKFQSIRVCAALESGNREEARAGIRTMLQTARLAGSQPLLISHLVRVSCHEQALSVLWHGLNDGLWRDEDLPFLAELIADEPESLLQNLETALNLEMCVMTIGAFDFLKTPESREVDLIAMADGNSPDRRANYLFSLVPDGIWDHNKAFAAEWMFDNALGPAMKREIPIENQRYERVGSTPRKFMARIIVPAVTGVGEKSYQTVVATELAMVALAVEQFHFSEGSYPNALEDLVPKFLSAVPGDQFAAEGGSIRYSRKGARYQLYSAGLNGVDEDGLRVFKGDAGKKLDAAGGDLTWGYTAN